MKKLLLSVCVGLLSLTASYGQDFLGISPTGSKLSVIEKFKAKGFHLTDGYGTTVTSMKGYVNGSIYELNIVSTPTTKVVCKFSVYLERIESFSLLKSEYKKYVDLLTEKYGASTSNYEYFKSPYYEGDGYEMTALTSENAIFKTYWLDRPIFMSVNISKWQQINIIYENSANAELKNAEENKLEKNTF